MELLSTEYGWTPDQIRSMRASDVESYIQIINVKAKIKQREMKRRQ